MEFEKLYDEFGGKEGMSPRMQECLLWSATWGMGGLMVIEEHRRKSWGANLSQGARTEIEEYISSVAAHPCGAVLQGEGGKDSGKK